MPNRLEKVTKVWGLGTQSKLQPELIKRGAFHSSMNIISSVDKFELLGGRKLMGTEDVSSYACLGLWSAQMQNGTWVMLRKNNTVLQSYSFATDAWSDVKTGLLAGEPMYFANSFTPAGRQIWCCGQDGLLKIYPSHITDEIDLTNTTKNYKGKILIEKSRMITIGMKEDPTGMRLSKVDRDSNYTLVSSEAAGTGTAKDYTGTLAHGQCFGVKFTKGSEVLTDDKNGNLIGHGTGTINYATGAYVLHFTTSNATAVFASYLWENPLSGGLADNTYSASRAAGEGNVLRQDATGTKSMTVLSFNNSYYTLQDIGSWYLTINTTDTTFDNQIYNTMVSCASPDAAVSVKDGIIFIDTTEEDKPKLRKLGLNQVGDKVIPTELSDLYDFTGYVFDQCTMIQFNDYIVFSAKTLGSAYNDTTFIYSLLTQGIFQASGGYNYFTKADNRLYGGDSTSPNVYEVFSGFDDLGYAITASVESGNDNLDTEQIKKEKKFYVEGYLNGQQAFDIYLAFDKEAYTKIGSISMADVVADIADETFGSIIHGDDLYGGSSSIVTASWFKKAFRINTPKHERVMWKIVPTGIGYFAITQVKFSDIRVKGIKVLRKYKKII